MALQSQTDGLTTAPTASGVASESAVGGVLGLVGGGSGAVVSNLPSPTTFVPTSATAGQPAQSPPGCRRHTKKPQSQWQKPE